MFCCPATTELVKERKKIINLKEKKSFIIEGRREEEKRERKMAQALKVGNTFYSY